MAKTMKKKSVSQQVYKPPRKPRRRIKINKDPTNLGNKQDVQDAGVVPFRKHRPQAPMCSIGYGLSSTAEGAPIPP